MSSSNCKILNTILASYITWSSCRLLIAIFVSVETAWIVLQWQRTFHKDKWPCVCVCEFSQSCMPYRTRWLFSYLLITWQKHHSRPLIQNFKSVRCIAILGDYPSNAHCKLHIINTPDRLRYEISSAFNATPITIYCSCNLLHVRKLSVH